MGGPGHGHLTDVFFADHPQFGPPVRHRRVYPGLYPGHYPDQPSRQPATAALPALTGARSCLCRVAAGSHGRLEQPLLSLRAQPYLGRGLFFPVAGCAYGRYGAGRTLWGWPVVAVVELRHAAGLGNRADLSHRILSYWRPL